MNNVVDRHNLVRQFVMSGEVGTIERDTETECYQVVWGLFAKYDKDCSLSALIWHLSKMGIATTQRGFPGSGYFYQLSFPQEQGTMENYDRGWRHHDQGDPTP